MSILAKTFFAFVGSHFMSLSLLSAWHNPNYLTLDLTLLINTFAGLNAGIL